MSLKKAYAYFYNAAVSTNSADRAQQKQTQYCGSRKVETHILFSLGAFKAEQKDGFNHARRGNSFVVRLVFLAHSPCFHLRVLRR